MPVLVVLVLVVWYVNNPDGDTPQPSATGDGVVLADDNEGSRHQRFILALDSGHTVLVAHNIDLAERVPVRRDGRLRLRGRYEWNDRGGVIHWTHHDPDGSVAGGWVRHGDAIYR
jgi:hypothetical protein